MGLRIDKTAAGHVESPLHSYRDNGVVEEPLDSYGEVQPDRPSWLARLPIVGKAMSFLPLAGFLSSSCSQEGKVGGVVAAAAIVIGLMHLLNRSINNRRIAALPHPVQILKFGIPRIRFPRKLDTAKKVVSHYMRKGFDGLTVRRIAYAWFLQTRMYSPSLGDLNQYDLQRRDLYGIAADFSTLANYSSDNELQEKMERVGCSRQMGMMFDSIDRGMCAVPELASIFLAMNIIAYHSEVGNPERQYIGTRYILSKFDGRSGGRYLIIREKDVRRMLEAASSIHIHDNRIVQGLTHLLCGGIALDTYEAGQYDGGLELGFAHIRSARELFNDSVISRNESVRGCRSVGTVMQGYPAALSDRAEGLWSGSSPGKPYPIASWSTGMIPQTTKMLSNFAVKPI